MFDFVVHGLKVTTPYTLDVKIPDGSCPKTTWIGPKRGVIAPGAQDLVTIRGFALTTRIDVENVDGETVFRAADFLRYDSSTRRFRLVTDLIGATGFEVQIATERFRPDSETSASCGSPAGLIYRMQLPAVDGDTTFTPDINFDHFLDPEEYDPDDDASDAEFFDGLGEVTVDAATQLAIENGAPMYVRAIPTSSDGTLLCERLRHGAAAYSIVSYIKAAVAGLSTEESLLTSGEYRPAQPPNAADYCVTAVKQHAVAYRLGDLLFDTMFAATGQAPGGVVQPGSFVCWNKSESVIDDVGDFLSGFVDAVASVVNYVARLYDDIKAEIVAFAGDAIEFVGIHATSRAAAFWTRSDDRARRDGRTALPAGLRRLMNEGEEYVKGYVASQARNTRSRG